MTRLLLTLHDTDGPHQAAVPVERLIIAGWTGRDPAAVQAHIDELAALGVRPPATVPVFYRVAAARLTTAPSIECTGTASSGEVEFVILSTGGRLWVGVGSDHTDREVETYGITVSKQMCDKPVGPEFWPLAKVAGHWDHLRLRSWADGVAYQDGPVSAMLDPRALMEACGGLGEGDVLFGGTLPVHGGIRPAKRFKVELSDPRHYGSISHEYDVLALTSAG